jgi:hypothetical protein
MMVRMTRGQRTVCVTLAALSAACVAVRPPFAGSQSPAILLPPGCPMLPADNIWNTRIDKLPVDAHSSAYIESTGKDLPLHPDFSAEFGYPYSVVDSGVRETNVVFHEYAAASDPGPYRIPLDTARETEGDRHVLVVDRERCRLYELFGATPGTDGWRADSGINIDLRSNALRHDDWTSADASGMAMLPGLVRYQEVSAGEIRHALRFTARTRSAHVWPARHDASRSRDPNLPPMGQRFRLRASFDASGFSAESRVIVTALERYGMFLADNGGVWYLSGAIDSRWNRLMDRELKRVKGSDFEAVDSSPLMKDSDSGEVRK